MSTARSVSGAPASGDMAPPVEDTQNSLTASTNANFVVTAYVHALLNTTLTQLANQGDWYGPFDASLKIAQEHAQAWVGDLGPHVFATIPQAIVNYSNTFTQVTNDVLGIMNQIQGTPTSEQQTQINQLIGALLQELQQQQKTLTGIQTELSTFVADVSGDHTNLLTGQNSAQAEVIADHDLAATISGQITQIQANIASDSAKALASEIGLGIAIFVMVVAIAAAVATEGAATPLVIAGIGLLSVGAAIGTTVVYSKDVSADIDQLHAAQAQLTDEQRQVTALQGVTGSIDGLVTANAAAQEALVTVLDAWASLEKKVQTVVDDLNSVEAPGLSAYIESLDLQAAQADWTQLTQFASGMEKSAISMTVQVVSQPTQQGA